MWLLPFRIRTSILWYIYTMEYTLTWKGNCAICRDTDGPRNCHRVKSEREKQTWYINAYMWNLEKWYRWTCSQSRNRDTDIENIWISKGKGEWDGFGDWYQHLYTTMYKRPEKAMAPHSSTLAWKIPRAEEPGRLQSMGSLGVGHDWATSLSLFTFMHWRRKWQPTPVLLPRESQGQGSLVGCRLWGRTESDTTEATSQQHV